MRTKAKLVHKYEIKTGVSQTTGLEWRRQDMEFQLLRDDWSETNEHIVVSCNNGIYLDAPALVDGAVGILGYWCSADEFNGRCYNSLRLTGWTPQSEAGKQVAEEQKSEEKPAGGLPF